MKSILTMAWTAEDPSLLDLAAKIARTFGARLVRLEPPSYGVISIAGPMPAWARRSAAA